MKVEVEKQENNLATIRVEIDEATVDKALDTIYRRMRNRINVPGFRKGKVPRIMVERMYGPEIFYEDATNLMISEEYPKAYDECELDIVSSPEISIVQIEKGKPFIFRAEVATRPEIKLGKYKGVSVTKISTTVTKKQVDEEINRELERNARVEKVDRKAKIGDTVVIDYEGTVDGVAFEGGKAEGHHLELGSKMFIDTFEDQIVGHVAGDSFDVNVTFPKEYHASELAGKAAVFAVVLQEVRGKDIPKLDDEYVQDTTEFETVDEYKESVKKRMSDAKKKEAKATQEEEALEKIVEASDIELPEPMVETQIDSMIKDYTRNLQQSGMRYEDFLRMTGTDEKGFRDQVRPEAEKQLKGSLVLDAIVKAEGIEATDEDANARIEEMSSMYGLDAEEMKKGFGESEMERLKKDIAVEKALTFISDNVKEVAKAKKSDDAKDGDAADEKKTEKKEKKTATKSAKKDAKDGEKKEKKATKATKKDKE